MDRRRVLFLLGLGGPGLWLTGLGLIRLSSHFVVELAGQCSFCGLSPPTHLAGVPGLPHRICEHCVDLCLEIMAEHGVPAQPVAAPELSPDAALRAELERLAQEERALEALIRRELTASPPQRPRSKLHCSFCDRSQREADKLIAGPNVYICDACIGGASALIGHLRGHLA